MFLTSFLAWNLKEENQGLFLAQIAAIVEQNWSSRLIWKLLQRLIKVDYQVVLWYLGMVTVFGLKHFGIITFKLV